MFDDVVVGGPNYQYSHAKRGFADFPGQIKPKDAEFVEIGVLSEELSIR
jgi:hypothetical protein